ncbi:MAG: ATP-binding cassette domain-containing protein [Clostridiales bacterium]|nr:ATP-binding cassette domain-containing protein [Clostridiales bacterium]
MSLAPLMTLNKLKKRFPLGGGRSIKAVEDISLTVFQGEKLGVVGESGCGKSTLGRVILQLYRQTSGACVYYGKSLQEARPRYFAREVRKLPRYQRRADKAYQRSLQVEDQARAARAHMEEFSAQASHRETRAYNRWSRRADRQAFRALELRKQASRQLREGSRTVGSLILSKDLDQVQQLYTQALHQLTQAHQARRQLLRLGRLAPAYLPDSEKDMPEHRAAAELAQRRMNQAMDSARAALAQAEGMKHQNLLMLTERCGDPAYWQKLDNNQESGINLGKLSGRELRDVRRDLQMIFQDPAASLDPRQTVGRAIEEPFRIHTKLDKAARKARAVELLEIVGMKEEHHGYYPHQLSGGQKQRVGIARAIALHPRFVVLDESLSALDVSVQAQVLLLLNDLQAQFGLTYFFITHNLGVVKHFCDRVMVMYLGHICELAPAKPLFDRPLHPYTRSLLASVPVPQVPEFETDEAPLMGEVPSAVSPPGGCVFHPRCPDMIPICQAQRPPMVEAAPGHSVCCHLYTKDSLEEVAHEPGPAL